MELAKVQEGYVPLILHQHTPIHRSNPLLTQGGSNEEAIEWAKRCPNPAGDGKEGELEIRQVFEADDFGTEFTPELREQEERIRTHAEQIKK